jgi:hypothetical protein
MWMRNPNKTSLSSHFSLDSPSPSHTTFLFAVSLLSHRLQVHHRVLDRPCTFSFPSPSHTTLILSSDPLDISLRRLLAPPSSPTSSPSLRPSASSSLAHPHVIILLSSNPLGTTCTGGSQTLHCRGSPPPLLSPDPSGNKFSCTRWPISSVRRLTTSQLHNQVSDMHVHATLDSTSTPPRQAPQVPRPCAQVTYDGFDRHSGACRLSFVYATCDVGAWDVTPTRSRMLSSPAPLRRGASGIGRSSSSGSPPMSRPRHP